MDRFDELWTRLDRLLDRAFGELDVHSPIAPAPPPPPPGWDLLFDFGFEPFGSMVWAVLKWLLAGF